MRLLPWDLWRKGPGKICTLNDLGWLRKMTDEKGFYQVFKGHIFI